MPMSYGRLREACRTAVDGTSIDAIEDIAVSLGLDAAQLMLPVDHLLLPREERLPSIVVTRRAEGILHFVLAWRAIGPFLQLMDPATGRRWIRRRSFADEVFVHEVEIPEADWVDWACGDEFGRAVSLRLEAAGGEPGEIARQLESARTARDWLLLGRMDATARLVSRLVTMRAIRPGVRGRAVVNAFLDGPPDRAGGVPAVHWCVRQAETPGMLCFRGAVILHVSGRSGTGLRTETLPPEVAAATAEPPARPIRTLFDIARKEVGGRRLLLAVPLAIGLGAGIVVEAVLFRRLIDLGADLALPWQRGVAVGAVVVLLCILLVLRTSLTDLMLSAGRRLEVRFRAMFLERTARVPDAYFGSRPASDVIERAHALHKLRIAPFHAGVALRILVELIFVTGAIIWLDPGLAWLAVPAAIAMLLLPLGTQPFINERDLRVRTHAGALAAFMRDGLEGAVPLKAHGGSRALMSEQEAALVHWQLASLDLQRWLTAAEGLHFLVATGFAVALVASFIARGGGTGALLLVYWALRIPMLAQDLNAIVRQYPAIRNLSLRLIEPLRAPVEEAGAMSAAGTAPGASGVSIAIRDIDVRMGGRRVLAIEALNFRPGEQVAIAGRSGAGKSTLMAVLLGLQRSRRGVVLVDGHKFDHAGIAELRAATAWVDGSVRLWNRSLLANLEYGGLRSGERMPVGQVLHGAGLLDVLERLPEGLATPLGEGGRLLSGGEGQRVRLGRSLLRGPTRLVLLDEPFAGLDPARRRVLLDRARTAWPGATLLYVTHDPDEALAFERVVILRDGGVAEDGAPDALVRRANSLFRHMLDRTHEVRSRIGGRSWRRIRVIDGNAGIHAS